MVFPLLPYSTAMKMEAAGFSETLVMAYQTTRHRIAEDVLFITTTARTSNLILIIFYTIPSPF
jgi:hypothetical protein